MCINSFSQIKEIDAMVSLNILSASLLLFSSQCSHCMYSWFSLFMVVMLYEVAMNADPMLLEEINTGLFLWTYG